MNKHVLFACLYSSLFIYDACSELISSPAATQNCRLLATNNEVLYQERHRSLVMSENAGF
jgi:hypothetical protein